MNLQQAQLGGSGNLSLGGYIPAAQRNPKLWQAALAQMIGQAGGEALSGVVSHATAPDMTKYAEQQGVTLDKQPWYKREQTPGEVTAMAGQHQNRLGTEAATAAGIRKGDQADRGLDLQQGEIAAQIARDKDAANAAGGHLEVAKGQLQVAQKGLELAKTKEDHDFWARQVDAYSGLLNTGSTVAARGVDSSVKKATNARAEAAAPGERKLTEMQALNQEGQARYHNKAAGSDAIGMTGGGPLAEDRSVALGQLGLSSLSPEKQQAAQQAALMVPMTSDRAAYRDAVKRAAAAAIAN